MQVGGSKIRASEDVRRYFEKHKGLNSAKHLLSIDGAENKKYLSTFKVQFQTNVFICDICYIIETLKYLNKKHIFCFLNFVYSFKYANLIDITIE